jgi:hypothetical protein
VIEQYLAEEAVGLAKSLGWSIIRGPYWNNNHIIPLNARTKHNHLYIESDVDEIKDGDYIRTSIGNGTLYVRLALLRKMVSSSMKMKANQKEISISSGGIRS